jgi:hypothetical protein
MSVCLPNPFKNEIFLRLQRAELRESLTGVILLLPGPLVYQGTLNDYDHVLCRPLQGDPPIVLRRQIEMLMSPTPSHRCTNLLRRLLKSVRVLENNSAKLRALR